MSSRLVAAFALLLLGCAPCVAAPEDDPDVLGWKALDLAAATPKALGDLRSPTVAHEVHVESGSSFEIGGTKIQLTVTAAGRRATWQRTRPGTDGRPVTTKGSLALPGVLGLPDVQERRYALFLRAADTGIAANVSSAVGVALPLVKGTGYLVDSDRDGVLGTAGDGYVAPESRTVGPWRGEGWTRHGGVRFRRTADGAWQRTGLRLPHPTNEDHGAAWCLLQWRRQQCGLLPVRYDRELEAAMQKHADYLDRNGVETHEEDPSLPGYTPEGDRAGRSSLLGFDEASMLAALETHLGTLYHRTRPLQPGLTHTAIVLRKGIFLLNVFERRGGPLRDAVLVYPPHGMEDVRLAFYREGESPMPVPGSRREAIFLGTAVNVFCEPLSQVASLGVPPVLVVETARGHDPVDGHLHFPGRPPSDRVGVSNRGNVAHVPMGPLRPRTRYEAHTRIELPGGVFTYRWWFETIGR